MISLFISSFWISLAFCEIVIHHGNTHNYTTRIEEDDAKVQVNTRKLFLHSKDRMKEEDTGVETIDRYDLTVWKDGKKYNFEYFTSSMTDREEEGVHIKDSEGTESLQVEGSYSYDSPGGFKYYQYYIAGKNGFNTEVSFGKNSVRVEDLPRPQLPPQMAPAVQRPPQTQKGIDSVLLCSLVGGGCKK